MKLCSKCKKESAYIYHGWGPKCIYQWTKNKRNLDSTFLKRQLLWKRYKLTIEQFNILLKKQKERCKICRKKTKLVVDHNHNNNIVRSLLCNNCNRGLGMFQESTTILKKAIKYIEKYND